VHRLSLPPTRRCDLPEELETTALEAAGEFALTQGVSACQIAIARNSRVVWTRSFGRATPETRFWVASATKPIVSSAAWLLIDAGLLDITQPVAHYIPAFAQEGKGAVTVEQVMLMTCGFPSAPMASMDGADPERRLQQLARWVLEYAPGSRYVYHGMSAHWVLAELIESLSGQNFCDFIEERITRPLGLPRLLGLSLESQSKIAQLPGPGDPEPMPGQLDGTALAAKIAAGEPGGGGVMTAATLALFYQALLHNTGGLWSAEMLADGVGNVRCTLPDPLMNMPANRTLGVVVGAGFGATWAQSPTAFGWPGAGGQIGFAEPSTGISCAFLQAGDPDQGTQFMRGVEMTNLALALGR
jgi:CubicO group peptidase (beta-lactamase class C family)